MLSLLLFSNGNRLDVQLLEIVRDFVCLIKWILEVYMRLDKYLKVSRLIKRRTVANDANDTDRFLIF